LLAHPAGDDLCPRPAPRPPDRPARWCPPALAAPDQWPPTRRPIPVTTAPAPVTPDTAVCPRCPEPGRHGGRPQRCVRRCPRQDRSCFLVSGWGPWGRTPTMGAALEVGPWPAAAAVPDCVRAARRTSFHVRGATGEDQPCPPWWPACGRPAGHPSGASDRRRHRHGHRHQPGHLCRTPGVRRAVVPEAADGQSADRSDPIQLPLPFLRAGPAGGRLRGRPRPAGEGCASALER
jgi:hypothetical protein